MIPLPCRLMIAAAAWIVPRSKRAEWKREWHAELWHRAQAGTEPRELLRRAWGAYRDAVWLLESERKVRPFDLFRRPLRVEVAFLLAAFLIAAFSGALSAPKLAYANASRLVTVDRQVHFAGARNSMFQRKYVALLRLEGQTFDDIILYRPVRGKTPGMLVSKNLLPVLGSKLLLGRSFDEQDSDDVTILSEQFWRTRFHADPKIVGTLVLINDQRRAVIGVLPGGFWFLSSRPEFYAPLDQSSKSVGMVGLLAPGETVRTAESELRRVADEVESQWVTDGIDAQLILQDPRPREIMFGAVTALAGALLGLLFLVVKRLGGLRYCLLLSGRVAAVLLGFSFLRLFALSLGAGNGPGPYTAYSLFNIWIFLMASVAALCLLIIDHRGRCLSCFAKLRMPAPIGVWSSQILDQPVTEYVCPAGHGALVVAGTGNSADHWTVLDDTWQDLFAHTKE